MQLIFSGEYQYNTPMLLRKCGYAPTRNRAGESSFVRVFGPDGFPRFHCYVEIKDNGFQINLHLDQKKPSYGEETAHSGDYDSATVRAEAARITQILEGLRLEH